ncbi:hypothetical protein B0H14DRAFT_3527244 [Mycena olivaceomarginata]|nr:hypothetical protein B0H14DRAFT_3527244 [Mycena olivaceomarginata]
MHKLLLPPLPFAAATLDPDPAPDPELDPEPEPSVGTAAGALVAVPKHASLAIAESPGFAAASVGEDTGGRSIGTGSREF